METFTAYLENLKNSLPVKYTLFNIQRLKIHWTEFKNFLSSLPDKLAELKNSFLQRLAEIKLMIDAIEGGPKNDRQTSFAFQQASMQMKIEMEEAILKLRPN